MTADLRRRVERLEQTTGSTGADGIRIFFEPRPCADPEAFDRQCRAEAGQAQAIIVRFVSPEDMRGVGHTLQ